jgi:hypothetical protein
MVEEQMIWQQRLDKQNNIIAAYQALYDAQEKELSKLEPNSLEYCRLNINQLQLADEIDSKKLYALRIVQDKEQQEIERIKQAKFAEKHTEDVKAFLRKKISNPITNETDRETFRGLLSDMNTMQGHALNNKVYMTAKGLGMIKE